MNKIYSGYEVYNYTKKASKEHGKDIALLWHIIKGNKEFIGQNKYIKATEWNNRKELVNPRWMGDKFFLNGKYKKVLE